MFQQSPGECLISINVRRILKRLDFRVPAENVCKGRGEIGQNYQRFLGNSPLKLSAVYLADED